MVKQFDTIGILAKQDGERVRQTFEALIADLGARDKRVIVDEERSHDFHYIPGATIETCSRSQIGATADLIVVIGGDGTLLDAGRTVAAHDTPILGVNLGRLGFMVDVLPAETKTTLDDIFAGRYIADSRLMLGAHIQRADGQIEADVLPALNECVIRNQASARVLDFDTYMNGTFISHHRADGLVVATPTGSTAYAMSAGGPVLHPGLSALAMVPICPHTLSDRPLIVDANHRIEVHVASAHDGTALFTSDGQLTHALAPGDRVLIERWTHDLKLIHPPGYDYFNILRTKLQWGRGQNSAHS